MSRSQGRHDGATTRPGVLREATWTTTRRTRIRIDEADRGSPTVIHGGGATRDGSSVRNRPDRSLPPEGFAVTEDPLETGSIGERTLRGCSKISEQTSTSEWSPAQPRDEVRTPIFLHWTDPPTGQVPAVLARHDEPDLPEWQRDGDTGPVWREHAQRLGRPRVRAVDARRRRYPRRGAQDRGPCRRAQALGVRRRTRTSATIWSPNRHPTMSTEGRERRPARSRHGTGDDDQLLGEEGRAGQSHELVRRQRHGRAQAAD